jgi:Ca2+-transporting ATPase
MDDKPGVGTLTGLSEAEAARRLREEGYNEIPSAKRRSILAIAGGVVRAGRQQSDECKFAQRIPWR